MTDRAISRRDFGLGVAGILAVATLGSCRRPRPSLNVSEKLDQALESRIGRGAADDTAISDEFLRLALAPS